MFSALKPTYKGILFALLGYSAFSVADICAKFLADFYPLHQLIAFENATAAAFLLACAPLLGGRGGLWQAKNLPIHAIRAVLHGGLGLLLTYCYWRFPIADVYTMIFTMPFFAALIGLWMYGDRVMPSHWLAMAAGFSGVVIAMNPGAGHFEPAMILPLLGSVLIAVLFIVSRNLKDATPFAVAFMPVAGAALLCAPFTLADFTPVAAMHIPLFVLFGFSCAVGMLGVSMAFRVAAASVVAPFMYVEMIWGLIAGYVLFGDIPGLQMLVGAGVIIASGFYMLETERKNTDNPP